jgi:hypothetical protein
VDQCPDGAVSGASRDSPHELSRVKTEDSRFGMPSNKNEKAPKTSGNF